MTRREYDKLRCRELAKRTTRGRLNRDVETRGGMKALKGTVVVIYDKHGGDVWVQTEPCGHCSVAFGCRVNAAAVDLIVAAEPVDGLTETQLDDLANDGRLSAIAMHLAIADGCDWPSLGVDERDEWYERAIVKLRSGEIAP